jgi:ribosome-binding protein aMBF1 (putative translation factor)
MEKMVSVPISVLERFMQQFEQVIERLIQADMDLAILKAASMNQQVAGRDHTIKKQVGPKENRRQLKDRLKTEILRDWDEVVDRQRTKKGK